MSALVVPTLAVLLTVVLYVAAVRIQRRLSWANPLALASAALIGMLYLLQIPYEAYRAGGDILALLLGPATVALAVPMHRQATRLRRHIPRLLLVVTVGAVVGMITAGAVAWSLGASPRGVRSAIPKSVTTPIAAEVSAELGGDPAITVAMVILTGLLGSIIGPPILALLRIRDDLAVGAAIGTSSHAVGTASLIRQSEPQGAVSSLAMAMAGIVTSILASLLGWYWR